MKKIKNILVIALPSLLILVFTALILFGTPEQYSASERRMLSQKPAFSAEKLANGDFMSDFESWGQDQFPLRNTFRKIKSVMSLYVLRQKANHDLYTVNGYLSKLEYPANENNINRSVSVLSNVYEKLIKGTDCKMYLSMISDKNRYLAPLDGYPSMNYDAVTGIIREGLNFATYIDISDKQELSDFYFTDQHWSQDKIIDVAQTLAEGLGTEIVTEFETKELDVPLYGAYVGQSALDFEGDKVFYLTNEILENCVVSSYSTGQKKTSVMYNFEKAKDKDAYEFFLSGSEPLLEIENPGAKNNRELVIFRDSFCSSLAPLLASGYSKITLVDLRYMKADMLPGFITFENQDVLFLYSTLIFNNSIG